MHRLRRLTAFIAKEVLDVMRQPRLVGALILGPFLILLLFGIGFTGRQAPVPVILVIPERAQLPPDLANRTWNFGPDFPVRAVTSDEAWATEQLTQREVEVVAILPRETYSTLARGEQITIRLLINAIDPVRRDYVTFVANFFVTDLNKQLVRRVAEQGQQAALRLTSFSDQSRADLEALTEALEQGNLAQAEARLDALLNGIAYTEGSIESSDQLVIGLLATLGLELAPEEVARLAEVRTTLETMQGDLEGLRGELRTTSPDLARYQERLIEARDTLTELERTATTFRAIPPDVLIAPLTSTTTNVSRFDPTYVGFYAPAVLALLIQHITVTFASLSLVRERVQGTIELFQVSPLSAAEVLTGKGLGYLLLTMALGLVLMLLLRYLLGVPIHGNPLDFVAVMVLEIVAALGWGFLISTLAQRESQAVQFSMLLLLASVFFSGFFLNISGIRPEVRPVSYALPVTYAIRQFQQIMLAGVPPARTDLLALAGMAAILLVASWFLYRRQTRMAA